MHKTVTIHVYAAKWEGTQGYYIYAESFLPETESYRTIIPIMTHEVEIEIPDIDEGVLLEAEIQALQERRKAVLAENHIRLQEVDESLSKLLAIPSKEQDHD